MGNHAGSDIFVRDMLRKKTRLVSRSLAKSATGNGPSYNPYLSGNGRVVVFQSFATDLVPGLTDANQASDAFAQVR